MPEIIPCPLCEEAARTMEAADRGEAWALLSLATPGYYWIQTADRISDAGESD